MKKYGRNVQTRNGNIKERMRTTCLITKATDTHSGYVILTGKNVFAVPHKTVTRTLIYIMFFAHCLPCYISHISLYILYIFFPPQYRKPCRCEI